MHQIHCSLKGKDNSGGITGHEVTTAFSQKQTPSYVSQKHGIFTSVKHRFTLCPVGTWRKGTIDTNQSPSLYRQKAAKGEGFLKVFLIFLQKNGQHKCQPFTIPTFQALNVRFSEKIFAIFLSCRKSKDFTVRMNGHRKSTRPLPIRCYKIIYIGKSQSPPLPPISVTSPPSVTSWLNMTSRVVGCWLKKLL